MTYREFITQLLTDVNITHVTKVYDSPPSQLNREELPVMYPRLPGGDELINNLAATSTLGEINIDLVIVVDPIKTNLHDVNFWLSVDLIDELNVQLIANALNLGIDTWNIRTDVDIVGQLDTLYWLVVASIRASG